MKQKISYTKPNGSVIEVNNTEDIREYAKSLGWKETNRIKKEDSVEKIDKIKE